MKSSAHGATRPRRAREFITRRDRGAWHAEFIAARDALESIETAVFMHDAGAFSGALLLEAIEQSIAGLHVLDDVVRPIAWPPSDSSQGPARSPAPRTPGDHAEEAAARAAELERMGAQSLWRESSRLQASLHELRSYLCGSASGAAERQALFVTGPAGSCETHLCCVAAEPLLGEGHPVLVILADRVRDPSPWQTLAREFGDPGRGPAEIATCLSASGEPAGKRALSRSSPPTRTRPREFRCSVRNSATRSF